MHARDSSPLDPTPSLPPGAMDDPPDLDSGEPAPTAAVLQASVPAAFSGERLDKVLAQIFPQFSRSRLKAWCEAGLVQMGGQLAAPRSKARNAALVELQVPLDPEAGAFTPEPMDLAVVWEDTQLAVIDKPAGLVVHPAAGNWSGTLLNGLLARYPEAALVPRAGIVHRLDKDTSGLLVVARTLEAQVDLVRQLQARTVSRQYLALAWGVLPRAMTVDAAIARHPRDRLRMAVVAGGKPARTHFSPLAVLSTPHGQVTALRCSLESGRTHQIRVHAQHAGLPLLGDALYGRRGAPPLQIQRQALHAAALRFVHPASRKLLGCVAPIAADVVAQWQDLGGHAAELDPKAWHDDDAAA
ncbi:RluA family pseudouridine synthase [Thiomonas sp. X19]|uniref:RluA family pseudouridine synthase n=1 Tax=Thiomonas sp. X19 TaxID=1050370 RepID=UPI0018ED89BE|nr:RluA family pseudouridine synthase [Thiomonas sp. X19]